MNSCQRNIVARNKISAQLPNGKVLTGRKAINYILTRPGAKDAGVTVELENGTTLHPFAEGLKPAPKKATGKKAGKNK